MANTQRVDFAQYFYSKEITYSYYFLIVLLVKKKPCKRKLKLHNTKWL